jgi:hypothetical protein
MASLWAWLTNGMSPLNKIFIEALGCGLLMGLITLIPYVIVYVFQGWLFAKFGCFGLMIGAALLGAIIFIVLFII